MSAKIKYIALACVVAALGAVSILSVSAQDHKTPAIQAPPAASGSFIFAPPIATFEKTELSILKSDGTEIPLIVELALTPQQQSRGMMFRTEMAENEGMLFVFKDTAPRSFWMKNTLIPLDMLFIYPDGTIQHIHRNAIPQDLTPVPSKRPAKAVLELNGGAADAMKIAEGDQVIHASFNNVVTPQ